ncbi:tetratricopeptide repeat protein [Vulgatibacter sp.]|uniref:tetratricopeptide repeat protein n=1 Tax=Vulgatibacter sp. TaxID=1971226 RepID=UPI003568A1B0
MEKELAEIRKEIVEARNLVIKNDNLLKNLGSDLKVMAKKQESFERKQWVSSGVAYLAFAALAATVGILGAQGYVAQARSEIETLTVTAAEATAAATAAKAELDASREGSKAALAAYLKLDAGTAEEREQAAMQLAQVDKTRLSRLEARALDDRGRAIIQSLADEKYAAGRTAYLRRNYKESAAEIGKAMALWPEHPEADDYAFYLGSAAIENQTYDVAAANLQRFVDKAKGRKNKDYAYLLLGQAYEMLGQKDKAEAALREGIQNYPASDFYRPMRGRLSRLRKAAAE